MRNRWLGEGITDVGSNLFSGCTGITAVTLPSTLASICENAFNSCI